MFHWSIILQVTAIHITEKALEKALLHTFSDVFGHGVLHATAQFGGGALYGAVAAYVATHQTRKARRKEKLFEKTGGLTGFSRTKANKEITKNWSSAVAGTSGSVGLGLVGAAAGTVRWCCKFKIDCCHNVLFFGGFLICI